MCGCGLDGRVLDRNEGEMLMGGWFCGGMRDEIFFAFGRPGSNGDRDGFYGIISFVRGSCGRASV